MEDGGRGREGKGREGTKDWELWACPGEREGEGGGICGVTGGQRGATEGWGGGVDSGAGGGEKPERQKAKTGAG